ncbi:hypothetical protein B0H13DRAFT_2503318 [Mycena leptocephala]|nr:hypothetical protein B0H13DRAFT_2503318 [Mycena leptocephala]
MPKVEDALLGRRPCICPTHGPPPAPRSPDAFPPPALPPVPPSLASRSGQPLHALPLLLAPHPPTPERLSAAGVHPELVKRTQLYLKALGDLALLAYSVVLFSFLRLVLSHTLFPMLARRWEIRKAGKVARFEEQGYAVVYFAVVVWGVVSARFIPVCCGAAYTSFHASLPLYPIRSFLSSSSLPPSSLLPKSRPHNPPTFLMPTTLSTLHSLLSTLPDSHYPALSLLPPPSDQILNSISSFVFARLLHNFRCIIAALANPPRAVHHTRLLRAHVPHATLLAQQALVSGGVFRFRLPSTSALSFFLGGCLDYTSTVLDMGAQFFPAAPPSFIQCARAFV